MKSEILNMLIKTIVLQHRRNKYGELQTDVRTEGRKSEKYAEDSRSEWKQRLIQHWYSEWD